MKALVRWAALIIGAAILLDCGILFAKFWQTMERFGGIPWSADLFWSNLDLVCFATSGLILVGLGSVMFAFARRRDPD